VVAEKKWPKEREEGDGNGNRRWSCGETEAEDE